MTIYTTAKYRTHQTIETLHVNGYKAPRFDTITPQGECTMPSQAAYDRYNERYDNDAYLAAVDGLPIHSAISMQDTALMLCEYPHSILADLVKYDAMDTTNAKAAFLALFI